jgi:peroxiredoxin
VLAVTDEGVPDTERFVQKNAMRYAYAYDKGGKLARHFGVEGIPHSVLIDPTGVVVWSGHPGKLEEALLMKATTGALPKPLWEWPAGAKSVRAALVKGDLKSAVDQAGKLAPADGGADIQAALQAMIRGKVEIVTSAQAKGDYLLAQNGALALQKELVGLPEAEQVKKVAADIAANKEALEVIKGQQKVAKIRGKNPSKKKEINAAIEDLRKLREDYPGTYVATEIDALIVLLQEQLRKG